MPERTDLRAALEELAATPVLLVALDFDGVLSPLVERAQDARPLPRSSAALKALAALPSTTTALISGRALGSLRQVASPEPETLLIGSHGAETWTGPDAAPLTLDPRQAELLDAAADIVESVVAAHPGTWLESKPAGVVLHTRSAADDIAADAVAAARDGLAGLDGLKVTDGKRVLEVSVVHADKGQGLGLLRELSGATAVLFAGDDVTDEHAFAVLQPQDVGIKIGEGRTEARYRLGSPEDLAGTLEDLLTLRRECASSNHS
ncbi:trehalose-phosphatase [Arthrobacter frigidicola]|nr:trehalose-phosphatase [Arthrobacter frigidicola]